MCGLDSDADYWFFFSKNNTKPMATNIIPHGVVYFLSEITADSQHMIGRSVRVNGT